jgi:predicted anti-sigma-YlaC factor YlaD
MNLMTRIVYPCEKIVEFTYDYLENNLPALTKMRYRLHLSNCPNCREFLRLYRMAADPKAFLETNPIPDDLLQHTMEFLNTERTKLTGP